MQEQLKAEKKSYYQSQVPVGLYRWSNCLMTKMTFDAIFNLLYMPYKFQKTL